MCRSICILSILVLLSGCISFGKAPDVYKTKVWDYDRVLHVEQQGRGVVEAEKIGKDWKIKTDYKSVPLLMDVTKLVAVKEMNKD